MDTTTLSPQEVGRLWFEKMWDGRETGLIRDLLAPDAIGHLEGGQEIVGPHAFEEFQAAFIQAIPDIRLRISNLISEGDDVCIHWHAEGTHTGDGFGYPPTGAPLSFQGVTWMRVQQGQIVEGWDFWNMSHLMQTMSGAATV